MADIPDPQGHQITAAQLAVKSDIEHGQLP
jgi:hypothetical protein